MGNFANIQDNHVFGLDIGTRSIVGVVGYYERDRFKVVAMASKEHDTRAMLDGQIHDIYKVGDTIRSVKNELEAQLDFKLSEVCIAAAGRVLKTVNVTSEYQFEEETRITQEHIYSLNLLAVEEAHNIINKGEDVTRFYCVGNTPIKYMLNDYDINNLEGHRAIKIGVELIATFLPDEVVDGLYEAVNYAGLQVANLTLEPIAAINIAIPEQYRLLNIALIDVGAGTSDICITKDGSVIAYGMIPFAGDEITEVIAKKCLVDFNSAEEIKLKAGTEENIQYRDIMGLTMQVSAAAIKKATSAIVDKIAKEAADKIIEMNSGKPVNAVFVIGGGGKIAGYTDKVAKHLKLQKERVAVRGEEVLTGVDFEIDNFKKDSLYVTPVGICTNYYSQKNNFIFVTVNGQRVKLYDNSRLTVVDAVMHIGFPNELLFPRRGRKLNFEVNGRKRLVRGHAGEGAVVKLNGRNANLNTPVAKNDSIEITESTSGSPAAMTIGQLEEYNASVEFIVNEKKIICPKFAYVNGELKSEFYSIMEGDVIQMENYYTVEQVFAFLDYDITNCDVYVNNEPADRNTKVYENFTIRTKEIDKEEDYSAQENGDEADYEPDVKHETAGETKHETKQDAKQETKSDVMTEIFVLVNSTPVRLSGKPAYTFVDIFDFYEFDLSRPKGNIVVKLNGRQCDYSEGLKDGDVVELYWEKLV